MNTSAKRDSTSIVPTVRLLLGALLAFGALNAYGGGFYGLSGADGVPAEWLEGSPFSDYNIPSLFLVVVVGGSLLFAAIAVLARHKTADVSASAAGLVVLAWIAVQVGFIGYVSWMQPVTFAAGLLILVLASQLGQD